jgi:hypothetical protein
MRNEIVVVAFTLLVLASAASAQVTGVVTQSVAQLHFDPAVAHFGERGVLTYSGDDVTGLAYDGVASTSEYHVIAQLQPTDIKFSNGATASGAYQYSTTTTSIVVNFTGNSRPRLVSVIDPGGFGIYLGDTSGCELSATAGCPQVTSASGLTFADLTRDSDAPAGTALGGATFSFTVASGSQVMEHLSGSITLFYNTADPSSPIVVTSVGGLATGLTNFGLETPPGSSSAIGYNWGQTDLSVPFPANPRASNSLTYTTVVSSYSLADCAAACQLVAYGGFGDPIHLSGGSGGDEAVPRDGLAAFGVIPDGGPDLINGVSYSDYYFQLPTYANGVLYLLPFAGVPEPAGWALVLLGTGVLGHRLRRRRAAA